MIVYRNKNILIRTSIYSDAEYIAKHMRRRDIEEIWASHEHIPIQSLTIGLEKSDICLTGLIDNEPVVMFGIVKMNEETGSIWLLGTDRIIEARRHFMEISKKFIRFFLQMYPNLCNCVHVNNLKSVVWLRKCGAKIEDARSLGKHGELFHFFSLQEDSYCQEVA